MRLIAALLLAVVAWAQPSAPGTPQVLAKTPSGDLRLSPVAGVRWDDMQEMWYFPARDVITPQFLAG